MVSEGIITSFPFLLPNKNVFILSMSFIGVLFDFGCKITFFCEYLLMFTRKYAFARLAKGVVICFL